MFKKICIPLMLINNNVYTFISGIFISLSTNIITTLCFEKYESRQIFLYVSSILFAVSGAYCIFLATKISGFQNFIMNKPKILSKDEQYQIVFDIEMENSNKWIWRYICLILSTFVGIVLLLINYFVLN